MPVIRSQSDSAIECGTRTQFVESDSNQPNSLYPSCADCLKEGTSSHNAEMIQNKYDILMDQYLMWAASQGQADILRNDCKTASEYRRLQEDQNETIAWTQAKRCSSGNKKIYDDWLKEQLAKTQAEPHPNPNPDHDTDTTQTSEAISSHCTCGKCEPKPGVWNFIEFELKPLHTLGEGKYGKVICARHESKILFRPTYPGPRIVAVKMIGPKNKESFEREWNFLTHFAKKGVTPELLAVTTTNEWGLLFMEKGMVTLKDLKDAIPRMSENTCKRFVKEIFALVKTVHDGGFIHHDLKLANILIMHDGTLRLCDGGMSRTIKDQRNQVANFDGKKCYYLAPEIREGRKLRKPTAVDVYCVGVALTHMRGVALREGMAGAVQEAFPLGRYPEAHEFLHSLMCNPPGTRLTAAQALKHPWLKDSPSMPLDLSWLEWWNPRRKPVEVKDIGPRVSGLFVY